MRQVSTLVSFLRTPLLDIGPKANEILSLGWQFEEMLPDRWTVKFSKVVPPDAPTADADEEIKVIMGDFWIDP